MADRQFNLDDYETVKSRKRRFYSDNPGGRIVVEAMLLDEAQAQFKALVYKTAEDQRDSLPWSTGHAQEFKGQGGFANKFAWCENCEESAIGRALDNAGYSSNGRCSREEMKKVENSQDHPPASVDLPFEAATDDHIEAMDTLWKLAKKAGNQDAVEALADALDAASAGELSAVKADALIKRGVELFATKETIQSDKIQ